MVSQICTVYYIDPGKWIRLQVPNDHQTITKRSKEVNNPGYIIQYVCWRSIQDMCIRQYLTRFTIYIAGTIHRGIRRAALANAAILGPNSRITSYPL